MMRSWTRRNGSSPLGSLSLDPRCGKIRADVNRQIIQKIAHTAEGGVRSKSLFGSGLAGLGEICLRASVGSRSVAYANQSLGIAWTPNNETGYDTQAAS